MYVSQVLNSQVKDSSDTVVGRLQDILIQPNAGAYAPLKFLVVKPRKSKEPFYISYDYVANLSGDEIALKNLIATVPTLAPAGEYVRLFHDIMDEQIVDVEGARVVRVNDLKLGLVENAMCVVGIDVSIKGILRRLGLARFDWFNVLKVNLIDWRKTQLVKGMLKKGVVQLDLISKDLVRLHPADLANIIEDLNIKQGGRLVGSLDTEAAAKVVEEMDPQIQKMIIHYLGPERASKIVERMSVDEAVDLMKLMPKHEARHFLTYLQQAKSVKVEKLLQYPNDTAGGLMNLDYVNARPEWTIQQTIDEVKRMSPHMRSLLYVYITDDEGKFKGAVSLRRLFTAEPTAKLKDIYKKLPKNSILRVRQKVNDIVKIMTKYNLYSAAVLDNRNRLVGILTIDDVLRHLVPHA